MNSAATPTTFDPAESSRIDLDAYEQLTSHTPEAATT